MIEYDFTIIGSGAVGMAIAFRIAEASPKAKIAVVHTNDYSSASTAAGAMLGCFGEVTKYTFAHPASTDKFDLMYRAHKAWPEWMQELESVTKTKISHVPGTHIILNTQGGILDEHNFQAVIDALKQYKESYEEIEPRSIEGLEPAGLAKPLRAIFLPNEGSVASNQYLEVLKIACQKRNITFVQEKVGSIKQKGKKYILGNISSEYLILAAGAATSQLIAQSGLAIRIMPVFAGNGVAMTTRRILGKTFKHTIRTSNRAGSCGLHLVPLGGKREYIGATNVIAGAPESEASLGMSHFLSQCAIDQLSRKLYFSQIEKWRVGNRPVSLDTLPLIGKTSQKNVYVATGTYRDGFHCSPVIAESIVNEIFGKKRLISKKFAPEREPIALMSPEESIKEFCLQEVSSAYETWLHLPNYLDEDIIVNESRLAATAAYKKLGTKLALHPDLLIYLTMPESATEAMKNIRAFLGKTN